MAAVGMMIELPPSLLAERHGAVAVLKLNRVEKRNALNDTIVTGIEKFVTSLPDDIGAAMICGEGDNFSAGLDLELRERNISGAWAFAVPGTAPSRHRFGRDRSSRCYTARWWAAASDWRRPATSRRQRSAYYALPRAARSIRRRRQVHPQLIGCLMDMMLTAAPIQ